MVLLLTDKPGSTDFPTGPTPPSVQEKNPQD